MNFTDQSQPRRFIWILLVIFLLTLPLVNPWVRGDGVGYYAYARAPLIEHSLDFTHDYQSANEAFREMRCDANGNVKPEYRTATGHLDNHFTVGPAMLWAPFLVVAHAAVLLTRAFGAHVAANGFSAPYRYAMASATAMYAFLGLLLSFAFARKYVAGLWAFLATVAVWWASSLPVYMYFNPSWSHAHSAFMVALFLYYWDATREQRTLKQWLVLGLIAGLMMDVYYANAMVLIALVFEWLLQVRAAEGPEQPPDYRYRALFTGPVIFTATVAVLLIPTFISRWIVYGGPLKSGYIPLSHWYWRSPVFLSVLFSSNHGLLSWTPLMGIAFVGLVLFTIRRPKVGGLLLASTVAFYCFISVYPDWAGISSYGNRFFISLTPIFILGLAYLLERFAGAFRQPRAALVVSTAVLACFVLWNLGMIYQWGTHLIPARGPISFREASYNQFFVVPRQIDSQFRSYLFRRSALMQQIEERDIEQQKNAQP